MPVSSSKLKPNVEIIHGFCLKAREPITKIYAISSNGSVSRCASSGVSHFFILLLVCLFVVLFSSVLEKIENWVYLSLVIIVVHSRRIWGLLETFSLLKFVTSSYSYQMASTMSIWIIYCLLPIDCVLIVADINNEVSKASNHCKRWFRLGDFRLVM